MQALFSKRFFRSLKEPLSGQEIFEARDLWHQDTYDEKQRKKQCRRVPQHQWWRSNGICSPRIPDRGALPINAARATPRIVAIHFAVARAWSDAFGPGVFEVGRGLARV